MKKHVCHPRIVTLTYYQEAPVSFANTGEEQALVEQGYRVFVPSAEQASEAAAAMMLGYVNWAEKLPEMEEDLSNLRNWAESVLNKEGEYDLD